MTDLLEYINCSIPVTGDTKHLGKQCIQVGQAHARPGLPLAKSLLMVIGTISPVVNLFGRQKHPRKENHLTLAEGGSEHA